MLTPDTNPKKASTDQTKSPAGAVDKKGATADTKPAGVPDMAGQVKAPNPATKPADKKVEYQVQVAPKK